MTIRWKERARAAGIHLSLSLGVAALAALLVFALWYPYPYREISGGRELFLLVVSVDVVLGPLLTFAIFDRAKPWAVLRRDLAIVALLQLGGLGYGLWTVSVARPVHLVFEGDRFRVIHAIEVAQELLPKTPPGIDALPWTGPTPLAVRPFKNEGERVDATLAAFQGVELGSRPDLWEPYPAARDHVLKAGRPVVQLKSRFPDQAAEIAQAVGATGRPAEQLLYLPMAGRKSYWTVLLDASNAQILGFLPLDSF